MTKRTSVCQRLEFFRRHQVGQSYAEIAIHMGVSKECVRYWCRRQRDAGDVYTRYHRAPRGLLSRFHPMVRYAILRLRLEHPRWGPNRILYKLRGRPTLTGLRLPSETQIGRYLHQWSRFRRRSPAKTPDQRPKQPTTVHQRWQLDFKMGIALYNGTLVNLHTVYDPVGEACLAALVYPAGQVGRAPSKVTTAQVRTTLRHCFARWGTLPQEVQTDHDTALVAAQRAPFPSPLSLWLKGLGIEHVLIRPGRPTDNAEVERGHRTICDYAIVGNEKADWQTLQTILNQAVQELAFELPSRAEGCGRRPPVEAHPELLQCPRPFRTEWELALFDLQRVDAYLSTLTWERTVSKTGQVYIGARRYSVGRRFAHRKVLAKFDRSDRHFFFYHRQQPQVEIQRRPALGLSTTELTGMSTGPINPGPQQLLLPLLRWPLPHREVCC
jgi:transposase InsO family protein